MAFYHLESLWIPTQSLAVRLEFGDGGDDIKLTYKNQQNILLYIII